MQTKTARRCSCRARTPTSSRTGQPDNSQGFIGISNKTYGTLTAGRVNTLSLDAINSYDPMGGSYAFSPLGFSGSFAGFGDTEAARANTAVKYRLDLPNFRLLESEFPRRRLGQWGGYDQGNGTNGLYQGQVGGDFQLVRRHALCRHPLDRRHRQLRQGRGERQHLHWDLRHASPRVRSPARPAAPTGLPNFYSNTDLKATLSNNTGLSV